MFELNGKYASAKVFTDTVDNESISQVINLLNQPYVDGSKIRMMPDIHAGAGCTIGTTMTINDKICPNLVGVDIGCTDKDTEILTPDGWVKISEYSGQKILVYDMDLDTAFFDTPYAYIKQKCDMFYHFYSKKGLDQMLSAEHKMLIWRGYKNKGYVKNIEMAAHVFDDHNNCTKSNRAIKTTFNLSQNGLSISDDMIRVLVMVSADGRIRKNKNGTTHIELHFKKQRKIERAKALLTRAGFSYNESVVKDGSTYICTTISASISKSLSQFYKASKEQLAVLIDEVYHWDGSNDIERKHKYFSTTDKVNADVVQFALATNEIRAGIHTVVQNANQNTVYQIHKTLNEYVGFPDKKFGIVSSIDGYKYCFTTSTGFFVIRRNNCISITGNCGMHTVRIAEKELDCRKLDRIIKTKIPSGFDVRKKIHKNASNVVLEDLHCVKHINLDKAYNSIGTLGGGNHFLEANRDDEGNLYIVVHSGSRHLGLEIAKFYQEAGYNAQTKYSREEINAVIQKLKSEGRYSEIQDTIDRLTSENKGTSIPKALAYVEGELLEQYLHDMAIAQRFAYWNRKTMIDEIVSNLGLIVVEEFVTTHNYIDIQNKILRKGAVSAQAGEKLLIPINMRDGSLVCTGKGNPDWNYSAPHGAGRLMSRGQAKEAFTLEEYKRQMEGIYTTSVNRSTLDEAPMAYKNMEDIVNNIGDTVEINAIIKPIYNFKAGDEK